MAMEGAQCFNLLDLPEKVLEKIVDHLPFVKVRNNLRLTCQRLYRLCNLEQFCRNEVIVWSKENENRMISAFPNLGSLNLTFKDADLEYEQVSKLFEQHGSRVHSLAIKNCTYPPHLLQPIISSSVGLRRLSIRFRTGCVFSFKPNMKARPTVTFLELVLDHPTLQQLQSSNFLRRIPSIFPGLKHLIIEMLDPFHEGTFIDSIIFDFVIKFRHLDSLELDVFFHKSFAKRTAFLNFLPQLKKLVLSFDGHCQEPSRFWKTFTSRLNASAIELHRLEPANPNDMEPLLSVAGLDDLVYSVAYMEFTLKIFRAFISSQVKRLRLQSKSVFLHECLYQVIMLPEDNNTLTDLILDWGITNIPRRDACIMVLNFCNHFNGLVHMELRYVNDPLLNTIFMLQKNLRSLVLEGCDNCTINGFYNTNENLFDASISNLQNLENLTIADIEASILKAENFTNTFSLPQLKYLRFRTAEMRTPEKHEFPVEMLESCVNLEALFLEGFIPPSSAALLSLFKNKKNLNYLSVSYYENDLCNRFYINLKHFYWIDLAKLRVDNSDEAFIYNEDIDRTVILKALKKTVRLYEPKISGHTVEWIVLY